MNKSHSNIYYVYIITPHISFSSNNGFVDLSSPDHNGWYTSGTFLHSTLSIQPTCGNSSRRKHFSGSSTPIHHTPHGSVADYSLILYSCKLSFKSWQFIHPSVTNPILINWIIRDFTALSLPYSPAPGSPRG